MENISTSIRPLRTASRATWALWELMPVARMRPEALRDWAYSITGPFSMARQSCKSSTKWIMPMSMYSVFSRRSRSSKKRRHCSRSRVLVYWPSSQAEPMWPCTATWSRRLPRARPMLVRTLGSDMNRSRMLMPPSRAAPTTSRMSPSSLPCRCSQPSPSSLTEKPALGSKRWRMTGIPPLFALLSSSIPPLAAADKPLLCVR